MRTLKNSKRPKVVVVGPGQMGLGAAERLLKIGLVQESNLTLIGRRLHNLDKFKQEHPRVRIQADYGTSQLAAQVVLLAVKPKDIVPACEQLKTHLNPQTLVISFVAAVSLDKLIKLLNSRLVVRAMPNLALQVGESYTRWYAGHLTVQQSRLTHRVLDAFGQEERVESDNDIDVHTIISGTGLASITYVLWGFIKAATYLGVRRADATKIVYQVTRGVLVLMAQGVYDSPESLTEAVKTPAGTTTRVELEFDRRGTWAVITDAMVAGLNRIQDLQIQTPKP